ncbi:MAG TPA: xanthine dehydrogenase accessory protein XdhC [Povalibacter sp.]|jgi:xanthine dehydrogenase accessory factor
MNALSLPQASETAERGWLRSLHDWPDVAIRLLRSQPCVARIAVVSVRGSAPREPGACMLITGEEMLGTIGGGRLEWVAVTAARAMLGDASAARARVERFVLGTALAQCCGGVVEVLIESYTRADLPLLIDASRAMHDGAARLITTIESSRTSRRVVRGPFAPRLEYTRSTNGTITLHERLDQPVPSLWLYGAGHVGQALVRILGELPLRITWIDSRDELLPSEVPDRVTPLHAPDPVVSVASAPPAAYYLVMSHCHALDYALCRAILERGDATWAGVIGSKSKAARFRSRLAADGVPQDRIDTLVSPIGVGGIAGKDPSVIAVAVAAQLLQIQQLHGTQCSADAAVTAASCNGACAECGHSQRVT